MRYTVRAFSVKRFGLIYFLYGVYNAKNELVTQGEAMSYAGAITQGTAIARKLNQASAA